MNKYKSNIGLKVKRCIMNSIIIISFVIIGACLYKMYDDIKIKDLTNLEVNLGMQKSETSEEKKSISTIIKEVIPTVVGVSKLKDGGNSIFLKDSVAKLGLGSGVVVSENGYILTNQHVSGSKYSNCYITFDDGKSYNGNVVWSDTDLDLSIVKISARGLKYIQLGNSDDINIADGVYAIGNPIGMEFQRTVTAGIISGINRTIKIDEEEKSSYMEDLIQTDATINPGNSGGPLINDKGEMIALNSVKITSAEGIGFAIPINIVKPVISKFINDGKFDEPYLGIFAYDKEAISYLDRDLSLDKGIYVAQISLDGPAYNKGLNVGDVITKIDGQEINLMSQLRKYIYQKKPDDEVTLTINKNKKESEILIKLGRK